MKHLLNAIQWKKSEYVDAYSSVTSRNEIDVIALSDERLRRKMKNRWIESRYLLKCQVQMNAHETGYTNDRLNYVNVNKVVIAWHFYIRNECVEINEEIFEWFLFD